MIHQNFLKIATTKKLSKGSGLGKFNNSHMKQITELVKQKQLLEPQYVNDLVRFRVGGV